MTLSIIDHDRAVRHYAMRMLADGYEVRARVEGWFDEPDTIKGYRPDIVARKGDVFLIVEIKKGEIDWPKIKALESFTSGRPEFQLRLITPEEIAREITDLNVRNSA
jgi:hypothetical protein